MTQKEKIQHLVDIAAKTVVDYHSGFKSVIYTKDEANIEMLAQALLEFAEAPDGMAQNGIKLQVSPNEK